MWNESNMIVIFVIVGSIIGFILGYKFYEVFGWKPEDPTPNVMSFLLITKIVCGIPGMIIGIFIFLGIAVLILK
jgi:hypothetical protein